MQVYGGIHTQGGGHTFSGSIYTIIYVTLHEKNKQLAGTPVVNVAVNNIVP